MASFVMLTRLTPEVLRTPGSIESLEQRVMNRIRNECPEVSFTRSLAVLGPVDYLDIFEAPDNEAAMKVAAIVRTFGHATTEVWAATEWPRFKEIIHGLGPG